MKDLLKTSVNQKREITKNARNDLQYQIEKLDAKNNWVVSENTALRSKIDLLESQLKSREETIKLQEVMFAKEKTTLEYRIRSEIMHQRPSVKRIKSFKVQEEQANLTNTPGSQSTNSTAIKLEPESREYTLDTLRKYQLPFYPEPSHPFLMKKKRKSSTTDENWIPPPRLQKKPRFRASLKVKPSVGEKKVTKREKVTRRYIRNNKQVLTLKGKVVHCFRQLPDQSGNVRDIYRSARVFGNIPYSSIRGTVSSLVSAGMLEKQKIDENGLTIYELSRLTEDKSEIAKSQL